MLVDLSRTYSTTLCTLQYSFFTQLVLVLSTHYKFCSIVTNIDLYAHGAVLNMSLSEYSQAGTGGH